MNSDNILNNLNVVFEKLFKSVEEQVYTTLDQIVTISPKILKEEPLSYLIDSTNNGLVLIANSIVIFFIIYFAFTQIINLYYGDNVENAYKFIIKITIIMIIVNNSYEICDEILNLINIITETFDDFFYTLTKKNIGFESLKNNINTVQDFLNNDIVSLNGIIQGMLSFGIISILINFAIRYVTVIFLILVSPLAVACSSSNISKGIFISWIKIFIVNLFVQIIVKIIILIPLMFKDVNSLMYKVIVIGSIYLIYKVDMFVKELFSKIAVNSKFVDFIGGK